MTFQEKLLAISGKKNGFAVKPIITEAAAGLNVSGDTLRLYLYQRTLTPLQEAAIRQALERLIRDIERVLE